MDIINTLFIIFCCFVAIPTLVFAIQVLFASEKTEILDQQVHSRVAVLVPAHNEKAVISSTLCSITSQLRKEDRLLVVADNCTDNTANLAREAGAFVIEREDKDKRGKGYALDFGLQFLANDTPPEIVIIIDADCQLSAGCLDILARQVEIEGRPVQALYLMNAPENKSITQTIAEFAWVVKNQVRPLGLKRLGLGCQLMGTGMAFPWELIRQADLAHGNMVEDMKLGVDLAIQGFSPSFCPKAIVTSDFPVSSEITDEQRKRWEHGHLSTIISETPRLLKTALKLRDYSLLSMALDLSIPPLSVLGLVLIGMFSLSIALAFFTGNMIPFTLMTSLIGMFTFAVFSAWYSFGRKIVAFKTLCGVPFYILRKIPLYLSFLVKRQQEWVKTERR